MPPAGHQAAAKIETPKKSSSSASSVTTPIATPTDEHRTKKKPGIWSKFKKSVKPKDKTTPSSDKGPEHPTAAADVPPSIGGFWSL